MCVQKCALVFCLCGPAMNEKPWACFENPYKKYIKYSQTQRNRRKYVGWNLWLEQIKLSQEAAVRFVYSLGVTLVANKV